MSSVRWKELKPTAQLRKKTFHQDIIMKQMKMETILSEKEEGGMQSTHASSVVKVFSGIPI